MVDLATLQLFKLLNMGGLLLASAGVVIWVGMTLCEKPPTRRD